jgi:hypothetical protein
MYSRWYNVTVVLLWLAAMTWLTVVKVLPPLLIGDRPGYHAILEARMNEPLVGWELRLKGERLGWALCTIDELPHKLTEIRSRVHFERLPLREIVPEWIAAMVAPFDRSLDSFRLDTESMVIIDPLGRLSQVESAIWIDPMEDAIRLRGTVEENRLKVEIRAGGELMVTRDLDLPSDAILNDTFSPQTQLPGLRIGQKWTVPTYSLLSPYNSPVEILTARVVDMERLFWAGDTVRAWLVVYHSEDGAAVEDRHSLRGRLWVRPDGTVLKQEVRLLNATMTFVRMPNEMARQLEDRVERESAGKYIWRSRPSRPHSAPGRHRHRETSPPLDVPEPGTRPHRPASRTP